MARNGTRKPERPSLDSGDALCAVDAQYRIVGWNRPAEQLFRVPEKEALGRLCYDVIAARDGQGAPVCGRGCLPMQVAARGLPVGGMDLERTDGAGQPQPIACTTITLPANGHPGAPILYHLFRPNDDRRRLRVLLGELTQLVTRQGPGAAPPAPGTPAEARLTGRELEIVRLLHNGLDTKDIAARLYVSPLTVRNHIQNVRAKLKARNRLQVVATAERQGLL